MQEPEKQQGVVSRYMPHRKFGFIRYTAGEIFYHFFEIDGLVELPKGQHVEFIVGNYKGKPVAKKVKPIHRPGEIIEATVAEVDLLKSYGVDLSNGAKVRAALAVVRSLAKDGSR
jgi:cold shock CspA family protein